MHEDDKLNEAARFLDGMRRAQDQHDELAFKHELSAFMTAARSVLQYALEEAKAKRKQAWYDRIVGTRIAFFKEERDLNVHERPVDPARATSVNILAPVALADAAPVAPPVSSGDTTVEPERAAPSAAPVQAEGRVEMTTRFFLLKQKDGKWTGGPEDAVTLAELYLEDVSALVADGRAKGILTV